MSKKNRREFLRLAGTGLAGAILAPAAPAIPEAAAAGAPRESKGEPGDRPFVLGPIQDIALIEQFSADRKPAWTARSAAEVDLTVEFGYNLPAVASNLLAVDAVVKDPHAIHGPLWTDLSCTVAPGSIPAGADGLRVLLLTRKEVQWWISLSLERNDGISFSKVLIDGSFPASKVMELPAPIADFRTGTGELLRSEDLPRIHRLSLSTSVPGSTLFLDRITAYHQQKYYSWLDYSTSEPATNLFQPDQPVLITFSIGGAPPVSAAGFRYEVRDFFGHLTNRGSMLLAARRTYRIDVTPPTHGYYEVSAYFVDKAGRDVEPRSCIRSEGTVPAGLGTFSVLPTSLAENRARFKKLGANSFFGLHGDFLGLADAVGLAWRFGYTGWNWLEPTKPDRSSGPAPWARKALAEPPEPDYRLHILPERPNLRSEAPDWGRSTSDRPPAFTHWNDYLDMLRDSVRVEKHLYPHMNPRIYGGAWEVNLNMPPYVSQHPEFTPADVVELFRRTRKVVKSEDPHGMVIGPCPSVLNIPWFETVFKAGVLDELDGIETHGYAEGVFTPEDNDYPGRIAALNALVRKFKGRTLPIYVTEAGQIGVLGADIVYRSQAQRMTRLAIILKGEGIRVFLPFYGIDYDRSGYWGFCFNLEVDGNPWGTKRISPKPMVNAIAVCAMLLEGASPETRLRTPGRDVWGYVFRRGRTTITAAWTTGQERTAAIPTGNAKTVSVVNIMGHSRQAHTAAGRVAIRISASPTYIVAEEPQ